MTVNTIKKLQKEHGYDQMQGLIENGTVWHMEGSMGRAAMDLLRAGACFLPKKAFRDYYGNKIPSRDELKKGTLGTIQNCNRFYGI